MPIEAGPGGSGGPICPNCRQPLRENLRYERLDALELSGRQAPSRVGFIYCGSCGWSLYVDSQTPVMTAGGAGMKVAAPADETTPEGQFQLRCRDLIAEIRALGFDPYVWVGLVNELGAVGAARRILADYEVLPVTHWPAEQGLYELTMEREIEQSRWADLFDEADRSEAARRLASAARHNPNH
jgi:hypothetical protein